MFKDLFDKMKESKKPSDKNDKKQAEENGEDKNSDNANKLTSQSIMGKLSKNADAIFRELFICGNKNLTATLVYIDGLVDSKTVGDDVIKPLMEENKLCHAKSTKEAISLIEHGFVHFPSQKTRKTTEETLGDILNGGCAIVFDDENIALTFDTKGFMQRSITEPTEENIVKGPKDVFVENIRVNTATLRRKIKSPDLVVEQVTIGRRTMTPVALVYMDGIVNKKLVSDVKAKLESIDVDGILESGFIEEYLTEHKGTTFPQVVATERPDVFSINLLEGHVGILIDGIPVSYIVPGLLYQYLRTPDDYSQNYIIVSLVRLMRYILMAVTLFLPAFYVAVTTFHHEMIPSRLALSIAASKEGVPYPAFIEVLLLLVAFEILLESGLRLPKNIGQAVSIVGALVVGEAAVNAKFISPAVVVVVAATAISGFSAPNQAIADSLRMWRIIMVILSSTLGLIGMMFGAITLLFNLATLEPFGIPYLSPFAGNEGQDLDDSIIRIPLKMMKNRPQSLNTEDRRRQK
ncbi:MAG: Spore germination protein B1 [Firmicutes bacterium ADurb.Bin193]|nr:MAG: Spore germination protein B1 [Firmicutes bacterium ADurb.Bin193]